MQSSQSPQVIQVAGKSHAVIQNQNGHHVILGKLANSTSAAETVTIQEANNAGQTIQTIYSAGSYQDTGAEQTVYSSNNPGTNHISLLDIIKKSEQKLTVKKITPPKDSNQNNDDDEENESQYQDYVPVVYTPVSGQQAYYPALNGQVLTDASSTGTFQTPATGNLHTLSLSGTHSGTTGALVAHQGATYILQQGNSLIDEENASLCHTAKASPITVQWLMNNYETSEGVSLPRSTLYFHYLQHCNEHKLEPMNPASFGKLIRSVFVGLRTRRLGTRGNSKYHYYGIRIKPNSPLNHYVEDSNFSMRPYHMATASGASGGSYHINDWRSSTTSERYSSTPGPKLGTPISGSINGSFTSGYTANANEPLGGTGGSTLNAGNNSCSTNAHQHAHYLGETSSALPNLEEICRTAGLPIPPKSILDHNDSNCEENQEDSDSPNELEDGTVIPEGCKMRDIMDFCRIYAESAEDMLNAVVNLDFGDISSVWRNFWRTDAPNHSDVETETVRTKLHQLVNMPQIQQFIRLYDHTFYQSLAEVLIPNVLRPIPPTLTQAIRNFAKSLEGWMKSALTDLDPGLVKIKVSAVCALAQTLRRYTSLNHLAQAARAVLKNGGQISQMLADLNKVDFNNVQEQASWACLCSDGLITQLEQDFKRILQRQTSLEEWAQWLDSVVTNILQPVEGNNVAFTKAAHQLILKWSFYSSLVIRDLTLRSAASFGSFHLIRLLYDEYIFYLIEHKVAAHLGMTPVAVMGEIGRSIINRHRVGANASNSNRKKARRLQQQHQNGSAIVVDSEASDPTAHTKSGRAGQTQDVDMSSIHDDEIASTQDNAHSFSDAQDKTQHSASSVGPSGDVMFDLQQLRARSGIKRAMIKTLDESDLSPAASGSKAQQEESDDIEVNSESSIDLMSRTDVNDIPLNSSGDHELIQDESVEPQDETIEEEVDDEDEESGEGSEAHMLLQAHADAVQRCAANSSAKGPSAYAPRPKVTVLKLTNQNEEHSSPIVINTPASGNNNQTFPRKVVRVTTLDTPLKGTSTSAQTKTSVIVQLNGSNTTVTTPSVKRPKLV